MNEQQHVNIEITETHTGINTPGGFFSVTADRLIMSTGSDQDAISIPVPESLARCIRGVVNEWAILGVEAELQPA